MTLPERRANTPADWVPAFDGQRPPVGPGNTLGLRHGAWSLRLVEPRALEIAQEMDESGAIPGFLMAPEYRPALLAYCRTLAQVERVRAWLAATASPGLPEELDAEGDVRAATRLLERLEGSAATQRKELGLTPMARARLGRDVASTQVSVTQLLAERRRDREGNADA